MRDSLKSHVSTDLVKELLTAEIAFIGMSSIQREGRVIKITSVNVSWNERHVVGGWRGLVVDNEVRFVVANRVFIIN